VEREHGRQARDLELVERAPGPLDRVGPVRSGHDQLRQQGVERPRDHVAGGDPRVDAHARTAGEAQHVHRPRRRQEVAPRVLAVDAELDGVAVGLGVAVVEKAALRDPELLPHQVDAGDLFGYRVLDLEPGVHLEERDRTVFADQELAGAGAQVADLLEDRLRRVVQELGLLIGEEGRGRLFHELLVPALQGAVAGRHDDDVAG